MGRPLVYYDLNKSHYSLVAGEIEMFFSSQLYVNKFIERYKEHRQDMKYRLSSRYNIKVDLNEYFDLILYSLIEKRGFKILKKGVEFTCLNEMVLIGDLADLNDYKK